jgi:hypothetical protein
MIERLLFSPAEILSYIGQFHTLDTYRVLKTVRGLSVQCESYERMMMRKKI